MNRLLNFIDGAFVPPQSASYIDSYNPALGEVHLSLADSDERDVDAAVFAARRVFPEWSRLPANERAKFLYRLADLIDRDLEKLAQAESADQGKPAWLAESMDIRRAAHNFRFFAGSVLHAQDQATVVDGSAFNYIVRKPVGVAGLISPWNLPLYLLTWKIAPALAFGNTVVCKPSEFTSHTAALLCELSVEAGLPPGVMNMVFGLGTKAGAAIVAHADVPLISFTGGTATGQAIARVAAPMFKKLSLELGGKNPNLIFADANLDLAVESTIRSSFLNQGEICLCGSRIYVQNEIYDQFLAKFVPKVQALRAGDPKERDTFLGPLVSAEHLAKVEGFIELAKKEGAKVLAGGKRPSFTGDALKMKNGYFLEATILTGVRHESRVQQEEIFGPVVTVTPFATENEVIELANGTKYGLSATVWTESLARAHRVSAALDAGTVWVNTWMLRDLRVPFGGVKASGLGREGQEGSREFFTEAKTICIHTPEFSQRTSQGGPK